MSDIIWRESYDSLVTGSALSQSKFQNALGGGGNSSPAGTNTQVDYSSSWSRWEGGKGRRSASWPNTYVQWEFVRLASALSRVTCSCAIYRRLTPTSGGNAFMWLRSDGVFHKIRIGPGGVVQYTRNDGTVLAVTTAALPLASWVWVSVEVYSHATEGYVRFVIKDVEDSIHTGLNTGTGAVIDLGTGSPSTTDEFYGAIDHSGYWWMDDWHVSNEILGERRSGIYLPSSDVLAQWIPDSGADNHSRVALYATASHVAAEAQGAKDVYGATIPALGDIDGITINIIASKVDAGDTRKVTGLVRIGGTDHPLDEHALSTTAITFTSVQGAAPGGAPWTPETAGQPGFELTAGAV